MSKRGFVQPNKPGHGVVSAPTATDDPWINLLIAVVERAKLDAQGILWYGVNTEPQRLIWMQDAQEFLDYMREAYAEDTPSTRNINSIYGSAWRNS